MVARLDAGDPGADFSHNPRPFVAENAREQALGIEPVKRIGIGVAHSGYHDFHQHFASFGPSKSSSTISSGCLAAKATAARAFMEDLRNFAVTIGAAPFSGNNGAAGWVISLSENVLSAEKCR